MLYSIYGREPGITARNPEHNAIRVLHVMKEFRTTLDDRSARKVTRAAKRMGVTVPAYIRHILKETHDAKDEKELERQHREGYRRNPVTQDEFLIPDAEQVWPEW